MGALIYTDAGLEGLLGIDLYVEGTEIRLYTNDVDVETDSEWADFTEATFPGYAAEACDFLGPDPVAGGFFEAFTDPKHFAYVGPGAGETCHGLLWVFPGGGDLVIAGKRFDAGPRSFLADGDFLDLVLRHRHRRVP